MTEPLRPRDIEHLAEAIRAVLEDENAHLSRDRRLRYEGALTALETVLGRPSSLLSDEDPPDRL